MLFKIDVGYKDTYNHLDTERQHTEYRNITTRSEWLENYSHLIKIYNILKEPAVHVLFNTIFHVLRHIIQYT